MNNAAVFHDPLLSGFDRTATEQATASLQQALRVLELVPLNPTDLTPHPIAVVRAEIENARRYLALVSRKAEGIKLPRSRLTPVAVQH